MAETGVGTTKILVEQCFGKARLEIVKKKLILPLTVLFVVAIIICLILRSSVNYKVMNYRERIMNQIEEEQKVYSDAIFEEIKVIRAWYSIDPTEWIYQVTLKDNGEVLVYEYNNGVFVQAQEKSK